MAVYLHFRFNGNLPQKLNFNVEEKFFLFRKEGELPRNRKSQFDSSFDKWQKVS